MRHNSLTTMTMFIFSSLLLHAQVAPPASAPTASSQTKSHSSAISPEKAAKIDEMLTVTGSKPALLKILAQGQQGLRMYATREIVVPRVASEKVTTVSAEEKKLTDDYLARMNKIADTEFGWNKLQPALLRYCADNFTDGQMDSIIAFYKSSAGKAMLEKGTALNRIAYDSMGELRTKLGTETDQISKAYIEKRNVVHPPPVLPPAPGSRSSAASPHSPGADGSN
jgi:hypothetical protein